MQNFTTKSPVAFRKQGFHCAPGQYKIKAPEFAQMCELQEAWNHVDDAKRQAQAAAEELRAQYRAEGLAQGRSEAQNEAMECMAQMKQSMNDWVKDTDVHLIELVNRCVSEVVNQVDPTLIVQKSIEKGLSEFIDAQHISIRVRVNSPELEESVGQLKRRYGIGGTVRILEDGTLEHGDVVVESPVGTVDLRLTKQLELINKALKP